MLKLRKSKERGYAHYGWLETYHTFSFADYYDPNFTGWGPLIVINEDKILGGQGFPTHGHKEMEIVTYVIDGAIEHKDSLGNTSIIVPGEIQKMSAGTGIRHSEYNPLADKTTHLYQIWIVPNKQNLIPSYEQIKYNFDSENLILLGSNEKSKNCIHIEQDVSLYLGRLVENQSMKKDINPTKKNWIQATKGAFKLNDISLEAGDACAVEKESSIYFCGMSKNSEFLLFEMNSV